jgi:transcription-repair coupling factor (superfamily II helicase)
MLIGQAEIEAFAAEMIDRFGPLPQEVENLLEVMAVKQLCRIAGVETVDAGPKGAVLSFHNNTPPSPERLIGYIQTKFRSIKLRPDQKLVYLQDWASPDLRVKGAHSLLSDLAGLVEG